jgi:hypothetical protein
VTDLIQQPSESIICGQCCVAMLTGATLSKVINLVGHRRGTKTKELVKVIRRLGYDCPARLKHVKDLDKALYEVERALVKITWDHTRGWHWVAWADGLVFDPGSENPLGNFSLYGYLGGRATSYLEISSGSGWAPMQMILSTPGRRQ